MAVELIRFVENPTSPGTTGRVQHITVDTTPGGREVAQLINELMRRGVDGERIQNIGRFADMASLNEAVARDGSSIRGITHTPAANYLATSGSTTPPPGVPGAPVVDEETTGNLSGFNRALQEIGIGPGGPGILRGAAQRRFNPLNAAANIGGVAGLNEGAFANLGEDTSAQDFFRQALRSIGAGTQTLGQIASQAFNATPTTPQQSEALAAFFNPDFNNGTGNAVQAAELARAAARTNLGTFARFLPSASELVQRFQAQPGGAGHNPDLDLRDFLRRTIGG